MKIAANKWIFYAQVAGGGTTYRERTSNMAEREMSTEAAARTGLRAMDPLHYIAHSTATMFNKLAKEVDLHRQWSNAGAVLVPHAIKLLAQHNTAANPMRRPRQLRRLDLRGGRAE